MSFSPTEAVTVRGEEGAVRRCIENLVANAVRYAGEARLDVGTDGGGAWLAVEDDGPGIPEEALGYVLEPFARLETSRSRETGGTGLGLSIARSLAEANGGGLRLENRPEGGLRAVLTFRDAAGVVAQPARRI